jgi:microcin C transport system permease protein
MVEYFIRRLLLTIPTFLGSTFVVFLIVQLAPGGPLEQQIQALKRGGETAGAGIVGEQSLPKEAIEELKRFYGFDKPIWQRYLIWLGVMKREAKSYRINPGVPRLVSDNERLLLVQEGTSFTLRNADDPTRPIGDWKWRQERDEETGQIRYRVYRETYSGILTGDFGRSYRFRKPVLELIGERLPVSIQFGIISFILSYAISIYLGVQKALRHNTPFDFATSSAVFMSYSIPGWAIGAVLLVLFATDRFFPIFPLGGFEDPIYAEFGLLEKIWDRAWHFVLPTIAYTAGSFALLTMLMKNSLIETLSQDYIRTAFAKGLREERVIWLHAMRNSIIPITANIGYVIGIFFAGSYLIERVFDIQGIGQLSFEALVARDYPIVFAFTVISVLVTLIGSILSDLALAIVDPRIRFK